MILEPFVLLFIVWHIRKNLRLLSPNTLWDKYLLWAMIGIGILFLLERTLPISMVTDWIWHVSILGIGYLVFRLPLLERMRTILIAVLPLIIINIIEDLLEIIYLPLFEKIEDYLDFATVFALTWMIAMLIRSNKQNKALKKERQKTLAEEERNKYISAQKEKLEVIVEERTAELTKQKDELMHAFTELKNTQSRLIQSEKMASLGELTAGIAHEIQNPLNFVNAIVKGMLQHSRSSSGTKEPTDINALADEYLRLAYHGLRAKDKSFNATLETDFDERIGLVDIIPQDMGRVILNLITNAFYASNERKQATNDEAFKPTVSVGTKKLKDTVQITVKDNGNGIPKEIVDKIFQPFFTTKPTGQGTGLGLSMSYDIVKAHGGELKVETNEGEGSKFIIILPV